MTNTASANENTLKIDTAVARSAQEIAALVQKRVQERDAWSMYGVAGHMQPNAAETAQFMLKTLPQIMLTRPPVQAELDEQFPVLAMDWTKLGNVPMTDKIQVTWLGHASVLIQMNGCSIVTDPVFSDRCSPSQWFGPLRYRKPPCTIQELCENIPIDLVLISHNHYDHLDYTSIRDFAQYSPSTAYVVPLGLRQWFHKHISTTVQIYEQDWHESISHTSTKSGKSLQITAIPVRHWSNRLADRDQTLWCGYGIKSDHGSFFFSGDTAWFDEMESVIGKPYGPFDVAAIPIGAYEPRDFMKYHHINVPEAVQVKDAVGAKYAVPIHWGTFPLTWEPVLEPRELLVKLMSERKDASSFAPWLIGETKDFAV